MARHNMKFKKLTSIIDDKIKGFSNYFSVVEIFSPRLLDWGEGKEYDLASRVNFRFLEKLKALREEINKPIIINHGSNLRRGFRHFKDQQEIVKQGLTESELSFHCLFCACDISIDGFISIEIKEFIDNQLGNSFFGGMGLYNSFVHLDGRENLTNTAIVWDFRK
jgi:hypothetical protein